MDNEQAMRMMCAYMGIGYAEYLESHAPRATCVDVSKPKSYLCADCGCGQYMGLYDPCWFCGGTNFTTEPNETNKSYDNAEVVIFQEAERKKV